MLTKSGEATVTSSKKKTGSETVYNLEIQELHNFLVGNSGISVHNACTRLIVKKYLNGTLDLNDFPEGPTKSQLEKLKELLDSQGPSKSQAERYLASFKDDVPLYLGAAALEIYAYLEELNKEKLKESECILNLFSKIDNYPALKTKLVEDLTEDE